MLVVAHVKELLVQAVNTMQEWGLDVGVYSAGLNSRDTEHSIIVAGVQSIYKRMPIMDSFDIIIVDEAHMIPESGEGMYRSMILGAKCINPDVRIIGLTATPYRMTTGEICDDDNILNEICYEIGIVELIERGFLCPLTSKGGRQDAKLDCSALHKRGGEFIESEMQEQLDDEDMIRRACADIKLRAEGRDKILVFGSGVSHCKNVAEKLREQGTEVSEVYGDTLFREQEIELFKTDPDTRYMVNCNVLTVGFDFTGIDCIVLLRATASPGLYYQMVGRGFRIDSNKNDCLVLDFGENVMRHGPVDRVRPNAKGEGDGTGECPMKECSECQSIIHAAATVCPDCGHAFPRQITHETQAGDESILSTESTTTWYDVQHTTYAVHTKKDAPPDAPKTMRVEYRISMFKTIKEWVCFEHEGYARGKAITWWSEHAGGLMPMSSEEAVQMCIDGAVSETLRIEVRESQGNLPQIKQYEMGHPSVSFSCDDQGFDWDAGV